MTFTPEQNKALSAPLDPRNVKPPAPGKYGEYVEGWLVIAEANRIFGFDGWTRETVDMIETNREQKGDKYHVGYRCRVRVIANQFVTREGSGFGSGVSKSLGDAIESAIKEAETDAMKRALMTFGNPFGLALYDKTKSMVGEEPPSLLSDAQVDQITTLAQAAQVPLGAITKRYSVPNLPSIPADLFAEIKASLDLTIERAAQKAAA